MHEHLQAEVKMSGEAYGVELDDGEFLAVISDPTLDRDGEIVDPGAFDPLPSKITVDIDHGMSVRSTVGSGRPFYQGDQLMIRGRFASTQLAQDTRTLVTEGHIDRMSVAFGSAKRETGDDGVPHVRKGELYNVAIVAIPANPAAEILAAKDVTKLAHLVPATESMLADAPTDKQADALLEALDAPTEVLVLDRPDTVDEALANDWSAAVTAYARSWTPEATKGDDEISTGEAPEAAAPDEAADKAADREAAARQRRIAVDIAKAKLALASTPTT